MSNSGSSQSTRRIMGGKHQWTRDEDTKLVECLTEMANMGTWKADNGTFRAGYQQQLEKWMHEKIPGTRIQGQPHIESRIKLLKKQYHAISEMLGPHGSGLGWNDQDKCIVAEKHIFDDWVKGHPNAAGLRNKPFPHYEELALVFGKDRATGLAAESAADACENIDLEGAQVDADATEDVHLEDILASETESQTQVPPTAQDAPAANVGTSNGATSARKNKRPRVNEGVVEQLTETLKRLGTMYEGTTNHIAQIATCFQLEADTAGRRLRVFEELLKLHDLSDMQRIRVGELISADANKVDYFFTLPEQYKVQYVGSLLLHDSACH